MRAKLPAPDRGAVAQLGERRVRNAEVGGSIPLGSTIAANLFATHRGALGEWPRGTWPPHAALLAAPTLPAPRATLLPNEQRRPGMDWRLLRPAEVQRLATLSRTRLALLGLPPRLVGRRLVSAARMPTPQLCNLMRARSPHRPPPSLPHRTNPGATHRRPSTLAERTRTQPRSGAGRKVVDLADRRDFPPRPGMGRSAPTGVG